MSDTPLRSQFVMDIASLLLVLSGFFVMGPGVSLASSPSDQARGHLSRAKVYLAAGDYRRAVEACQTYLDESPSVQGYVYLTYVYHTINGYLEWLAQRDEWVKVGQLSLSFGTRGTLDLVDPPDVLARMAKEILAEGLRQQFDITAAMANRLDKNKVDQLWQEQETWKKNHPDSWWAGVPEAWGW